MVWIMFSSSHLYLCFKQWIFVKLRELVPQKEHIFEALIIFQARFFLLRLWCLWLLWERFAHLRSNTIQWILYCEGGQDWITELWSSYINFLALSRDKNNVDGKDYYLAFHWNRTCTCTLQNSAHIRRFFSFSFSFPLLFFFFFCLRNLFSHFLWCSSICKYDTKSLEIWVMQKGNNSIATVAL